MPNEILTKAEIDAAIQRLDGWTVRTDKDQPALEKTYVFSGFNEAFGFMSWVLAAERANHHPNGRMSITRCASDGQRTQLAG